MYNNNSYNYENENQLQMQSLQTNLLLNPSFETYDAITKLATKWIIYKSQAADSYSLNIVTAPNVTDLIYAQQMTLVSNNGNGYLVLYQDAQNPNPGYGYEYQFSTDVKMDTATGNVYIYVALYGLGPTNWKLSNFVTAGFDDTITHTIGGWSVKIDIPGTISTYSDYAHSDYITVLPDTDYTLSGWGKGEGLGGTSPPGLFIVENTPTGNLPARKIINFPQGIYNWSQISRTFRTGLTTTKLYVYGRIDNGYGKLWYDDLELIQFGQTTNLILNGTMTTSGYIYYGGTINTVPITNMTFTRLFSPKVVPPAWVVNMQCVIVLRSPIGTSATATLDNTSLIQVTPVTINGLVGHFPLDTIDTNNTTPDISGDLNIGYVYGAPTIVPGKFGNAINFNGPAGDYIEVPNSIDLNINNSPISIAFWFKWNAIDDTGYTTLLAKEYSGPRNGYMVLRYQGGNAALQLFNNGIMKTIPLLTSTNNLNTWYHVTFTYDNVGTGKAYLNGILDNTVTGLGVNAIGDSSKNSLLFGRRLSVSKFLQGAENDIRIYDRVLADTEVYQLATGCIPLNCNLIVA